ncbi:MAG TPA: serine hydrolase [Waterburya sp.]
MKLRWFLPGLMGIFLLSSPAKAGSLQSWHFNRNLRQLDVTTNEGVQPRVFLMANPSRLVIDLPSTQLGQPQTQQRIDAVIQTIRVGQFDADTTRMVVELAPGYTINPKQVQVRADASSRWVVQLPTPERLSASNSPSLGSIAPTGETQEIAVPPAPPEQFAGVMALGKEMPGLEPQIKALMARYSFLTTGMFFLDLDTGNYLDISGDRVFPAASTVKLPILVAYYQALEEGKVNLDETLVMRRDLITGGSGDMQYQRPGTKFSTKRTLAKMIIISDNTATNMIIDRLGGIAKVNQRFRSWGLKDTVIRNWLADLKGTNTTSSKDMVRLLAQLANGKLVSSSSRAEIMNLLSQTTIKTLLPAGIGSGAQIANKTGDIGFLIGDAGMITMPNGKRYLAGIFVRRPYDDTRGRDFIRQVSRLVYNYLDQQTAGVPINSSMR